MSDTATVHAWDAVADAWDDNVDRLESATSLATAGMVDRLAVRPGEHVLELAAGPGALAATWSALVGTAGTVLVTDLSPSMVEVARRRTSGLDNVSVARIDAAAIDLASASFDVVACQMGLMLVPDPAVALAEVRRVLAPGGRFGGLTWGAIEANPWMTCVGMAAMMHGLVAGGPPIGPGGPFSLGDPSHLATLTRDAGFVDVAVDVIDVTFTAPDIETHVARVGSLAGPLAVALGTATADQRAAALATAADLATSYLSADGLAIPGRALLVSARR